MPATIDDGDLYARGKYKLAWDRKRDGSLRSPFLQIVWYDQSAGRFRSKSTATADIADAERELDRLYQKRERGEAVCPTCGQMINRGHRHLLADAIANYLIAREDSPSYSSIKPRLAHVSAYLVAEDLLATACEDVDAEWINAFRKWAIKVPITDPKTEKQRPRSAGTVEASVRQLAAAVNHAHGRKDTLFAAAFSAKKPEEVSRTPTYRADIKTLAAMFRYAMTPNAKGKQRPDRLALLRFLQISVITWCRPDAAHDISADIDRRQWLSNARVLDLNPAGRTQTRKFRPAVPIGERGAVLLDATSGWFVPVDSVRKAFEAMLDHLKLPRDRETGMKLIRRSIATIARKRLGEEHWVQGQRMLGHMKPSTSDVYALFETGQLGRALAVTDAIIADIEKLAPGAFHRSDTGLRVVPKELSA